VRGCCGGEAGRWGGGAAGEHLSGCVILVLRGVAGFW
jgi:hypothetical protein